MPRTVTIDGRDFRTVAEFFDVIGEALIPGRVWGKNLDAFNDILCWPLAGGQEPYVLVWRRSNLSRRRLNHVALEQHYRNFAEERGRKPGAWQARLIAQAEQCQGPTAFELLVEIIEKHPDWLTPRLE